MPLDPATVHTDPFVQLGMWLAEAESADPDHAHAFALATASTEGMPSVRMVLLRGVGREGLEFFTNRASRKGRELAANAHAAAVFHWPALERQLRVAGPVVPLDDARTAAYWATRPRGSQLSAWASVQGAEIASREALEARVETFAHSPDGAEPDVPPFWGGYRLIPRVFEFWEGRQDRLHDRVEYLPDGAGGWRRRRLQP